MTQNEIVWDLEQDMGFQKGAWYTSSTGSMVKFMLKMDERVSEISDSGSHNEKAG